MPCFFGRKRLYTHRGFSASTTGDNKYRDVPSPCPVIPSQVPTMRVKNEICGRQWTLHFYLKIWCMETIKNGNNSTFLWRLCIRVGHNLKTYICTLKPVLQEIYTPSRPFLLWCVCGGGVGVRTLQDSIWSFHFNILMNFNIYLKCVCVHTVDPKKEETY